MSVEQNKAVARRIIDELFHQGALDHMEDLVALDAIAHDPGADFHGVDHLRRGLAHLRAAFPDLRYTIEDVIAEGDRVVVRFTGRGTHRGEFRGIAGTGKSVTYTGILIQRIVNGKLVELWGAPDLLGLLQQLGVMPGLAGVD